MARPGAYADTNGYEKDGARSIWPYRDWVIRAFNRDLPFDRFTIEQIAGDLLPSATLDQRVATGFHRNTMANTEGGIDDEEFRVAAVVDRVNTTMQVWMGTTMACAQCHDHKYDPYSQKEYFRLFAFFNNTADRGGSTGPEVAVPTPAQARSGPRSAELARQADSTRPPGSSRPTHPREIDPGEDRRPEGAGEGDPPRHDDGDAGARPAPRDARPDPRQPQRQGGARHARRAGGASPDVRRASRPDRLGLARWLVDPGNPLVGRVLMNRIWAQYFGRGIVETSEDFGVQGEPPSHPELLAWLAKELVRQGWSLKAMHRLIVTSATYRQSSRVTPDRLERDPFNRLFSRGPRFRMEAEMVRDQALALGGLLKRDDRRPERLPLPARRDLVRPLQRRSLEREPGRRPVSPGPLYLLATLGPVSRVPGVRRPQPRGLLRAAIADQHAPPGAGDAQRPGLRPAGGRDGPPHPRRVAGDGRGSGRLRLPARPGPQAPQGRARPPGRALFREPRPVPPRPGRRRGHGKNSTAGTIDGGVDRAELAAWTVVANVLLNLDETVTKG